MNKTCFRQDVMTHIFINWKDPIGSCLFDHMTIQGLLIPLTPLSYHHINVRLIKTGAVKRIREVIPPSGYR